LLLANPQLSHALFASIPVQSQGYRERLPRPIRATPAQVNALLLKSGVKELDPEYQALKLWLADQGDSVSKADVQAFVAANKVEVKPVVLDKEGAENDEINGVIGREGPRFGRHPNLQLPGEKSNYREEFLTAPETKVTVDPLSTKGWTVETTKPAGFMSDQREIVIRNEHGERVSMRSGFRGTDAEALADIARSRTEYTTKAAYKQVNWQDGHADFSDIKNPIGRIRANDRTLANGETMHFGEEFQQPSKDNFAKMPKVKNYLYTCRS